MKRSSLFVLSVSLCAFAFLLVLPPSSSAGKEDTCKNRKKGWARCKGKKLYVCKGRKKGWKKVTTCTYACVEGSDGRTTGCDCKRPNNKTLWCRGGSSKDYMSCAKGSHSATGKVIVARTCRLKCKVKPGARMDACM